MVCENHIDTNDINLYINNKTIIKQLVINKKIRIKKMYYHSQLRNLQKQAQLQRKLAQVTIAEDLITSRRQSSNNHSLARSRRQQDQQTSVHLRRSRLQAQLQASTVSTTAILNRSRIQSALQGRQRNHELNTQRQKSLIQEQYYQAARLAAQQQIELQRQREMELSYVRQVSTREEVYRRIKQEEERLEDERRQAETRRRMYEQEVRWRELMGREIVREQLLRRPYYYY